MDTWESCSIAWLFTDPSHTAAVFGADAPLRNRAYKLAQGHRIIRPVPRLTRYEASYSLTQDTPTTEAFDEFVSQLVESGWEALPDKGLYWWNRSFHRKVTA